MFELRVMTGLHQGAVLPLIGAEWTLGATDKMDLCLFDPSLEGTSIELSVLGSEEASVNSTWLMTILEGGARDIEGHIHHDNYTPVIDVPFQIGDVWLVISHTDSPWGNNFTLGPYFQNLTESHDTDCQKDDCDKQIPIKESETFSGIGIEPENKQAVVTNADYRIAGYRKRMLVFASVFTAVVTSSVLAIGIIQDSSPKEILPQTNKVKFDVDKRLSTPKEVRFVLQKMLNQRELSDINIEQTDTAVVLKGTVSEDIEARFERMLNRFKSIYSTDVTVIDEVILRQQTLPFEIVQIHAGHNGHIVTSAGQRLFIGDEVDGIRLLSIAKNRIEFGGAQVFAVVW